MRTFCLLLSLFITLGVQAQHTPGTLLTGKVTNEQNQAVEFATVVLVNAYDSTDVKQSTATDTIGRFSLVGVTPGKYIIKVMALGYKHNKASSPISVESGSPTLSLGVIALITDPKALGEVIVQGERPMVERSLGKLTLNVANTFFKTATNALEVLRRAPGVQVDPLGAITLSGAVTPVVYVDGKQLPLTSEELKGLATTDIEQVEIMANASGRYDGETKAVINIKLKRDKALGVKGSTYAEGLLNRRYAGYSTGISSSYKTKQGTYYGRVGFYDQNDFLMSTSKRIVRDAEDSQVDFDGSTFVHYRSRPLSYLVVADYAMSKKHTIGVLIKGLIKTQRDITDNITGINRYENGLGNDSYLVPSATLTNGNSNNTAVDVNYRGTLSEKGDEIVAYADYASFYTLQNQDFQTAFPPTRNTLRFPTSLLGQFPTTTSISSLRSDYVHVYNENLKINVGGKVSWTKTDNELIYDTVSTTTEYVRDYSRSNRFLYKETTAAGYVGMTGERGKNSMELIVRLEQTNSIGNSLTLQDIVYRNYYRLLPSFQFYRKLSAQNTLSLTVARKVRRPSFYDLNPFRFYINPYEYNEGNPFLKAATTLSNRLEANYKDVSVTVGYDVTSDQAAQLPIQDRETNVIRYSRANLDRIQTVSLSASAPLSVTKWWKMQSTLYIYHIQTNSRFNGGDIDNSAFSLYAYGQQTFTLPKNLTLEINYDYSAPSASQIYRSKSSGTVNLSIQKAVLKDKGTIQMQANDLFNTYREAFYGQYQDVDVNALQTRNVQQVSIRFTYQFGVSNFVRKGKTSGSAEEEGRANR